MEFGIKCCMPTIVYLGLNTAIYFLHDFQNIALISNAAFMFLGLRDKI